METPENGRGNKVIALASQQWKEISQEDLLEERMLTHAAENAIRARDAKREWIRYSLEHGGGIESGPLKAELRKRANRRGVTRRQRDDDCYSVLVVYV